MNSLLLKYLLLGLFISFLSGCIATQNIDTPHSKNSKFLLKKLEKNKIIFDWFAGKAKLKFTSKEQKISTSITIRMKKDSLIWLRIKKMNIEGLRIKISPETIEILDRQNVQYIRKPFSTIRDDFGLDLSFGELQNLLVGNPIWYKKNTLLAAIEDKKNVLRTAKQSKEVLKLFFDTPSFLLAEMRGSTNNNAMQIVYSDYQKIGQQSIAFKKEIEVDSEEKGLFSLHLIFSKIELNTPQKMKFIVPDNYK